MLKVLVLLKRNPKLTMKQFIEHYENNHVKLGIKSAPKIKHYSRRYLTAAPYPLGGAPQEPEYDVLTELWFDDRKAMDENAAALQQPEALAAITADEAYLFDTSKNRLVIVEDHVTDPATLPANQKK